MLMSELLTSELIEEWEAEPLLGHEESEEVCVSGESVPVMLITGWSAAAVSVVGGGVRGMVSVTPRLTSATVQRETQTDCPPAQDLVRFLMSSDLCRGWRLSLLVPG